MIMAPFILLVFMEVREDFAQLLLRCGLMVDVLRHRAQEEGDKAVCSDNVEFSSLFQHLAG